MEEVGAEEVQRAQRAQRALALVGEVTDISVPSAPVDMPNLPPWAAREEATPLLSVPVSFSPAAPQVEALEVRFMELSKFLPYPL